MTEKINELILNIDAGPDADAEEKERVVRQLREELMELDVESVDFAIGGEVPVKAKGFDPISLDTLLLTLVGSAQVITGLISVLQSWRSRQKQRSISLKIGNDEIKIEGTKISSKVQNRMINTLAKSSFECGE